MDARFLGLESTADPLRWEFPVGVGVTSGKGFLFGGCYLAAAVAAMETVTERSAVWATTQFGSAVSAGDVLSLSCQILTEGRSLTQGRVVASHGDDYHSTTLLALGRRKMVDQLAPRSMPAAIEAGSGPIVELDSTRGGLRQRMEIRSAEADETRGGRSRLLWLRFPGTTAGSSTSLAIVADFLAPTFSGALGRPIYGASLDNTIRFFGRGVVEWLLVETRIDGLADGIGHGTTHVWGQDGQLLAVATQTSAISDFGS